MHNKDSVRMKLQIKAEEANTEINISIIIIADNLHVN